MRRGAMVWLLILVVALCSGCMASRFVSRNFSAFGESQPVKNKVTSPMRADARLSILWVGHSTVLIQMDDKFVLTDPVFTSTVGLVSPRLVEPGIEVQHLPPLDAVLISHVHFDHLSLGSVAQIESKVRWFGMPQGGLVYLTDFDFPAQEIAWWKTRVLPGGMKVTAVPVKHGGWRYGLDYAWREKLGYTAWVIEYRDLVVYFGGDSALDETSCRETARKFPRIDIAFLPIGPIEPRDFMKKVHIDPKEALMAFSWLGARWMVPIHYGTFINSSDDPGDPERALAKEMAQKGIRADKVVMLQIGEQRVFVGRQLDDNKITPARQ